MCYSCVSDDEWECVVSYLTLIRLDAPQRDHDLRAVFDALRWIVRAGAEGRMLPHDFPPWEAVYQQGQRWLRSGAFATIVHGSPLGSMRIILNSRTLQCGTHRGIRSVTAPDRSDPRSSGGGLSYVRMSENVP